MNLLSYMIYTSNLPASVCSMIRNTHSHSHKPYKSPWHTSHRLISECWYSGSPVIQRNRQLTAVLHKHRSLPSDGSCSLHLYLQKPSRWDSFKDKWVRWPRRTSWGLWDICRHTCHTPDWQTEHTQPQQPHTQRPRWSEWSLCLYKFDHKSFTLYFNVWIWCVLWWISWVSGVIVEIDSCWSALILH